MQDSIRKKKKQIKQSINANKSLQFFQLFQFSHIQCYISTRCIQIRYYQSIRSHSISGDHFEVAAKLQKHVSAGLIRIDANSIHRENRSCFFINSKLYIFLDTSSQTQRMTAEKGASSGTEMTLKGCSISEVSMTLKVTLLPLLIIQQQYKYLMNFNSNIVVIDNGTGYTKMGYAGNTEPSFDIPTLITDSGDQSSKAAWTLSNKKITETLDFSIGNEARDMYRTHRVVNPIEGGIVRNWDLMEKFWHRSIFDYLRCDPQETVVVLTEPPLNPPENRQHMAQIMFQTFNVKGLYIGVQAVFALISSSGIDNNVSYTGTVLDSGDGVTHIIPVVDGFVINSCIKHIPLAGSNITKFIADTLRDRNERCPVEEVNRIAKNIKEKFSYVIQSGDLLTQFQNFDNRMSNEKLKKKYDKYIEGVDSISKVPFKVSVGPERFLAPEMFFNPEIVDQKYRQPVDQLVDKVIQLCPIDTRRQLYSNIALSGGSTLFKGFKERLERRVRQRVDDRLRKYEAMSKSKSTPIEVKVLDNPYQRYAVWLGGSMLAGSSGFNQMYHTRDDYFERGSSICRYNAVFSH